MTPNFPVASSQNDRMSSPLDYTLPQALAHIAYDQKTIEEFRFLFGEKSKQNKELLDGWDKMADTYERMITDRSNENERLQAENKALKACVESHEETIKTLKADIRRRNDESDNVITVLLGDKEDIRTILKREHIPNTASEYQIDQMTTHCFNSVKEYVATEVALIDAIELWYDEEGNDCSVCNESEDESEDEGEEEDDGGKKN